MLVRGRPSRTKDRLAARVVAAVVLSSILLAASCRDERPVSDEDLVRLIGQGQWEEALPALEARLREERTDPDLLYRYAEVQSARGRPSAAFWALRRLYERPEADWRERVATLLVQVTTHTGDSDLVVQQADEVLEAFPDLAAVRLLRAQAYVASKDYERALEDADRLLEDDPSDVSALALRLQVLLGLKRADEFEASFDRLEALTSAASFPPALSARFCTARAVFADEDGQRELAATRFEACLEAHPDSPDLLQAAVAFYDGIGSVARATALLEAALERSPEAFALRQGLASRLSSLGDAERARALLLEIAEADGPQAARAWTELAYHHFDAGEYDRSLEAWDEVRKRVASPGPSLVFAQAETLIRAGRTDEARALSVGLPGHLAEVIGGLAALEEGDAQEALVHFDRGQRLWPNSASVRYHAGLAAEYDGDLERAVEEYRQAVRIDAAATSGAWRLARILEGQGQREAAQIALSHAMRAYPNDLEARLFQARIAAGGLGLDAVVRLFRASRWPADRIPYVLARFGQHVRDVLGPVAAVGFFREVRSEGLVGPAWAEPLRVYAEALAATGDVDEARAVLAPALAAAPDSAALLEIGARIELAAGASDDGIAARLDRALVLDGGSAYALETAARVARAAGRPDEALALFERAARAGPERIDVRIELLRLLLDAGRAAEVRRELPRLFDAAPGDARVSELMARALLALGTDLELAERHARTAVRLRGGASAQEALARVLSARGGGDRSPAAAAKVPTS